MLTVARCGECGTLTLPPDVVCTACGSTDPAFEFTPVSGRAVVRSWTVIRQAFLPGFDRELPFVLVDVELVEQAGSCVSSAGCSTGWRPTFASAQEWSWPSKI